MFDFSGKVVLITGATGNLGSACVLAFATAGATLVIPDRNDSAADHFPELAAADKHLFVAGIDATNEDDVARLVDLIREKFGRLDVLVNTVGGYRAGELPHETAVSTWDFMLSLNGRSTFLINQAVAPLMMAGGGILNTAAKPALQGHANDVAYSAAKSTVARITESMAAAYKKHGITANAIMPGSLDTPQNRAASPDADFSKWVKPETLAQLFLFLASEAGKVVNGALIPAGGLA